MVFFKEGVAWDFSKVYSMDAVQSILRVADKIYAKHDVDVWVTSLMEGKHKKHSRHYIGTAVDLRIRHLRSLTAKKAVATALQKALGDTYFVFLETHHIHVQLNNRKFEWIN